MQLDDMSNSNDTRKSVRLGSGAAYTLAAQVIVLACSFITSILVARALGPTGKGQLTIIQQVPSLILVFISFGIAAANTYHVGTGKQRVPTVLGNSIVVGLTLGVLAMPLSVILTNGRAAVVSDLPLIATLIAATTLPLALVASFITAINTGLGEIRQISLGQILGSIGSLLLIIAMFLAGRLDVIAATAAAFLALIVALAWNAFVVRKHTDHIRVDLRAMMSSARYSLKAYLGNLAGYLNYRQDVILVGYLAGAASVGVYSIAVTFAELVWYIPNSIATALFAKSMASDALTSAEFTARTSRIATSLMMAVAIAGVIAMRPIIGLLYSQEFTPAYGAFVLLLPGVLLTGIGKIVSGHLVAQGKLYPAASVTATLMNLVLNAILIPWLGFKGAALASSFSYSFLGLFMMWQFRIETGMGATQLVVPSRGDLSAAAEALWSYRRRR